MTKKESYRYTIILLKYFPIIGSFLLWVRVLLLVLFDYQNPVIELFVGNSIIGGVLLLLASRVLEFCKLHKFFIYYNVFAGFCIDYQQIIGWGEWRDPMRGVVLGVGVLLFIMLMFKKCCCKLSDSCY